MRSSPPPRQQRASVAGALQPRSSTISQVTISGSTSGAESARGLHDRRSPTTMLQQLEDDLKRNVQLFHANTIHKVLPVNDSSSGGGAQGSKMSEQQRLAEEAQQRRMQVLAQMRSQLSDKAAQGSSAQRTRNGGRPAVATVRMSDGTDESDQPPVVSPFLAVRSAGAPPTTSNAVVPPASVLMLPGALVPVSEREEIEQMFSKEEAREALLRAPIVPASARQPGAIMSPTSSRRLLHRGNGEPLLFLPESLIVSSAASTFEAMLLCSLDTNGSRRGDGVGVGGLSPQRRGSSASDANAEKRLAPAPQTERTSQPLRHPSLVPVSHYVKAQLTALRFSIDRGFDYHKHFALHVNTAAEQQRIAQAEKPALQSSGVDFVVANRRKVRDANPTRLAEESRRNVEIHEARKNADPEEFHEWLRNQIHLKRDLMRARDLRRRNAAAALRTGGGFVVDDKPTTATNHNGAKTGGSAENNNNSSSSNPLATLSSGSITNETDMLVAAANFWYVVVALGTRTRQFEKAAIKAMEIRLESERKTFERSRLNTEHMSALVALDTMKQKYEKCREYMRQFVQRRLRRKHGLSVQLILRFLRHRHRIFATIHQVRWYRRSVMIVQRQVRVFLQSVAARRMLLHLQWIRKECALLQVPNQALEVLHQSWSEQRRLVEATRMIATELQRDHYAKRTAAAAASAVPASNATYSGAFGTFGATATSVAFGAGVIGNSSSSSPGATLSTLRAAKSSAFSSHTGAGVTSSDGEDSKLQMPLRKPGSSPFVVWSTKITFVPQGGVPLEFRSAQINLICQDLVRSFMSSLVSADANRRFYVKQRARFETDNLADLGLPRPQPPKAPTFQLFLPANTLHYRVRTLLNEKGGASSGAGGGVTGGKSGNALRHQPSFVPRGGVTKADEGIEAPGAATEGADFAATARGGTGGGVVSIQGAGGAATAIPIRRGSTLRNLAASMKAHVVPNATDASPPRRHLAGADAQLSPLLRSEASKSFGPLVSATSNSPTARRSAALKRNDTADWRCSAPSPLANKGSSTAAQLSPARRSMINHFDSFVSSRADLPTTVKSDAEYAKILGKESVKAMREFLREGNTLHLRGLDATSSSTSSAGRAGVRPSPRSRSSAQDAPAASPRHASPSSSAAGVEGAGVNVVRYLPLHVCSIQDHYESVSRSEFADHYHVGVSAPMVVLAADQDAQRLQRQQQDGIGSGGGGGLAAAPKALESGGMVDPLPRLNFHHPEQSSVVRKQGRRRSPEAIPDATSAGVATCTTQYDGSARLPLVPLPPTSSPRHTRLHATSQLPHRHIPAPPQRQNDVIDATLSAHRPAAPGEVTRRQHEVRLRVTTTDDTAPTSSLIGFAASSGTPAALSGLLMKPEPPIGSDVERDVPRLLAYSGSTERQRLLMVCGGSQLSARQHRQTRTTAAVAPLDLLDSRNSVGAVAILTELQDARSRGQLKAQARRVL